MSLEEFGQPPNEVQDGGKTSCQNWIIPVRPGGLQPFLLTERTSAGVMASDGGPTAVHEGGRQERGTRQESRLCSGRNQTYYDHLPRLIPVLLAESGWPSLSCVSCAMPAPIGEEFQGR